MPGVQSVEVQFDAKKVIVTVESSKRNDKALLEALKKIRYGGKIEKPNKKK